jgi:hypothetical protein
MSRKQRYKTSIKNKRRICGFNCVWKHLYDEFRMGPEVLYILHSIHRSKQHDKCEMLRPSSRTAHR